MGLYNQFATDKAVEKDGVVLEYGTASNGETIGIRIARAGGSNTKFQKELQRRMKPYRRQVQTDTMDEKVAERILREVFADTVILDWENVEDASGKPLEFTRDNVIKVLEDLPDLFADIQEASQNSSIYRKQELEEDAKN